MRQAGRLGRGLALAFLFGVSAGDAMAEERSPVPVAKPAAAASMPLRRALTEIVPFATAPFPYRGIIPDKNIEFIDIVEGGRAGHTAPRGGVYWEDTTYSDRSVLLYLPAGFDLARPAMIVVYFHGNFATLRRDVIARQGIPRQFAASGLNGVLVAPQMALDANDSSSGHFWDPGRFRAFLREAAENLAALTGRPAQSFDRLPVVIAAYSGGYQAAAFSAALGGAHSRIAGIILFDALYAEEEKLAEWIAKRPKGAFFLSTYSQAARASNGLLQEILKSRKVGFRVGPPAAFAQGGVTFYDTGPIPSHEGFMTRAWTSDPFRAVLAAIPGFKRAR